MQPFKRGGGDQTEFVEQYIDYLILKLPHSHAHELCIEDDAIAPVMETKTTEESVEERSRILCCASVDESKEEEGQYECLVNGGETSVGVYERGKGIFCDVSKVRWGNLEPPLHL